ncbi:MAG: DUF4166 domain-containing protein [Proteobacteria bacterium]|nr:DUF4166 domain-containing protein [Pseudomonadota bacterium]
MGKIKMTLPHRLFADKANRLDSILQQRYDIELGCNQKITLNGFMTISGSMGYRLFCLCAKLIGKQALSLGQNIPVTVYYGSNFSPNEVVFERLFHFPNKPYRLCSKMIILQEGIVVEMMSSRIGCKLRYELVGNDILLSHQGYVFKLGQRFLLLPLTWLLGKAQAIEHPVNDSTFYLRMEVRHWMGRLITYEGNFTISPNAALNAPNRAV